MMIRLRGALTALGRRATYSNITPDKRRRAPCCGVSMPDISALRTPLSALKRRKAPCYRFSFFTSFGTLVLAFCSARSIS